MAAQDDGIDTGDYGAPDPQDILAQQATAYAKSQQSNDPSARFLAAGSYGLTQAFGGGPQVQQAKTIQQRMKEIIAQVTSTEDPDADPIVSQMRMASAMSTGMADLSPKISLMANDKMVKLQQAQTQQQALQANIAGRNAQTDQENLKTAQGKAAQYVTFESAPDETGVPSLKEFGKTLSLYNPDGSLNTNFFTDRSAQEQAAKDAGFKQPVTMTADQLLNGRGAVADTRARVQLEQAEMKAAQKAQAAAAMGNMDPKVLDNYSLGLLTGQYTGRGDIPKDLNPYVQMNMVSHGLNITDGIPAKAEIKALNAAATQIGSRDGKTMFLEGSLPGMFDTITDMLDGKAKLPDGSPLTIDRTRIPALNSIIMSGKSAAGDPSERAYSAAINSLVQEYARVASGGTGVTSDAARAEVRSLVEGKDSPEAMKAVLSTLKNNELKAFSQAGPTALALLTQPDKFPHVLKIQQAFGVQGLNALGADTNAGVGSGQNPNPNSPPPDSPAVTAGKATLNSEQPAGDASGIPDGKTGNGGKYIARGGKWYRNK